jgi:hypothetical protein
MIKFGRCAWAAANIKMDSKGLSESSRSLCSTWRPNKHQTSRTPTSYMITRSLHTIDSLTRTSFKMSTGVVEQASYLATGRLSQGRRSNLKISNQKIWFLTAFAILLKTQTSFLSSLPLHQKRTDPRSSLWTSRGSGTHRKSAGALLSVSGSNLTRTAVSVRNPKRLNPTATWSIFRTHLCFTKMVLAVAEMIIVIRFSYISLTPPSPILSLPQRAFLFPPTNGSTFSLAPTITMATIWGSMIALEDWWVRALTASSFPQWKWLLRNYQLWRILMV